MHPYARQAQQKAQELAQKPTAMPKTSTSPEDLMRQMMGALGQAGGGGSLFGGVPMGWGWREMEQQALLTREQMGLEKAMHDAEMAYRYALMRTQDEQFAKDYAYRVGQMELQRQMSTGWVQQAPITEGNMPALDLRGWQWQGPREQLRGGWPTLAAQQMMGGAAVPSWARGLAARLGG